ncbi:MAG: outer membrane beta-barrel family protein [Bacteroidota bacterium]
MGKYIVLAIFLIVLSVDAFSQKMSIAGNVQDTTAKVPVESGVVMAVRLKDSILIAHTRTDAKGAFRLKLPIDTVHIIISHPKFGDQSFYVFGSTSNYEFDFGKIILPPKSHSLQEIVIYAYKDPVYYKGDTLIYTADSFKVKPNATVEDLLKKLPGIKVDSEGKITAQGKKVDQVLVDGDEFFGTDPTVATQNLNAKAIESVQVYEKKNETASDDGKETVQVMNLKLKEDAKKGYFGKLSGASDFQKFYEGEVLANKFNNRQKISVFALGSNTPRSSLGWGDIYKYGLNNEMNLSFGEDGEMYRSSMNNQNVGVPRTLKTGVYYTDKISPKTKITSNYTYNNYSLTTGSETTSQYFLNDTSYKTKNISLSNQLNESHTINFNIVQKLDSLTDLEIIPKLKLNASKTNRYEVTDFLTSTDTLTRRTEIANNNKASGYDLNTIAKLTRKFKKRDRLFVASYNYILTDNISNGKLISNNIYFNNSIIANDSINQQKISAGNSQSHNATLTYTEPITKKIKMEFSYDLNYNLNLQDKKTLNYANGEYAIYDSLFTNNFENIRLTNRLSAKYIYEVKKQRFIVGTKLRQVSITSNNLITNQTINQSVNNVLPFIKYLYKFSDSKRLNIQYTTNSNQPSIDQLQPVQDNTNPNQIKKGNPNLLPTFKQDFSLSYSTHKPISGSYFWTDMSYSITNNAFANAIEYDTIGRTITTPVNVNGNYNADLEMSGTFPIVPRLFNLSPELSFNYNSYSNFINSQRNITKTANTSAGLSTQLQLDTLDFSVGYSIDYNAPSSSLNPANNKPYSTHKINANLSLRLPFKCALETDFVYTINTQRTQGYNINYFIWNASLKKTFFKNENFILSIDAVDILNQNINTSRTIQDNVITDNKTNIISRYILLKAVYKFNSNKIKENEMF